MNHHGAVRAVVFTGVLKLEALRQVEVPLHGSQLPEPTDSVLDLEVYLRAVERGLALDALVRDAASVERLGQRRLGLRPALFRAEPLLRGVVALDRQLEANLLEAEGLQHFDHEVEAVGDLLPDLLRRAEQVRVVNSEAAHAQQAVERPRQLGAIDRTHLGVALRQVAVRALLRAVDADVERAVHRLDAELRLFELHRREHRVAVVLLVAADLPQFALGDVRRIDEGVAAAAQLLVKIILHRLADDRALRVPEDESSAVGVLNGEEVEFTPQTSVVAALGLLALFDPRVEFFLSGEGRAVDALHLRALRVAHPVSAGEREQLERLQTVRVRHVRAEAEVQEGRAVNVIDAHLCAALVGDQLALQRLLAVAEDSQRLFLRNLFAAVGEVALCQLAHALLNDGQVFVR